jgi:hypothetical protein
MTHKLILLRLGPAHSDFTYRGEGLGRNLLRPPGSNEAQTRVSRSSEINGGACLSQGQNHSPPQKP